ncbi:hypothetical protein M408DRAFT_154922 [Serendipita vermifera MAFF 305830]|uniref:Uncharacterized protein n=1 Tax=Serendipita vermifera MAFF 305830 TaxID=933852 RepID=A0A0C2XX86_SERVB|nr:hypothetical protein M408DRAFT_154922 [Serendipita vermifera MAFF 305830]
MMHIAHQPLGLPVHDTRLLAQSMYTQPQPGYHTGHRHADNYEQSQMHRSAAIPPGVYAMEAARHGSQTTSHPEQSYYSGSSTMHLNDGRRVNDTSNRGYVTSTSRDVHLQQAPRIESSSISRSEVWKAFPLDNDDHKAKREALYAIMQSSWKQNNDFEPEASVLMQFMEWDPIEKRWHCKFWKGGKRCTCSCRKRDHGKGHIRSHLDLLPFVCDSQCPYSANGCGKRYPAVEPLQKHRKGKTDCDYCALPVLPTNMKRHIQTCHPELFSKA